MTYDGENRPLSVTLGVNTSGYVYGADGTRLMKLEQIGTQPQSTTLYVGGVEIREPGVNEVVLAYPHENVRLKFANANSTPEVSYLFRDHLNSVRMIADENQAIEERSTYKPFGEENESVLAASKAQETIGWIGERHDAGAGLQYLNARYYDPELGLFIQPDWWEVTKAGVGTNRYSYSANDPINFLDPGGNIKGNSACDGCTTATNSDGWSYSKDSYGEEIGTYNSKQDRENPEYLGTPEYSTIGAYHKKSRYTYARTKSVNIDADGSLVEHSTIELSIPSNGYSSEEEAALAVLRNSNNLSRAYNIEFGGLIYGNDRKGNFGFTGPVVGTVNTVATFEEPVPVGTEAVANYHTHSDNNDINGNRTRDGLAGYSDPEQHSIGDITINKNYGLNGYLATPSGAFRVYRPD